ncbi:CPBP family intramembrane glutamic endopeptidase [Pseudolysinimonas sp.]|uniref:CPBP family intramembrane glutamic endopeptidase n=1 Tax=Pseudolysinimonas sp. TaxID=2680009 RepID=UPI00286CFBE4|nr:CPBP family intramembrane glutamic endopeptidase [Pseudolysinimonas sp.]
MAVHIGRFAVLMLALTVAPLIGISGWYMGLFANVACVLYAVVLVTVRRLWRTSGILVGWRGPRAAIVLLVLIAEVLVWAVPGGLENRPPGYGLWALTLLLVGINEELTSRVVVLERLRAAFGPLSAVVLTAALFGLQHLSAFATTGRDAVDIAGNIVVSACTGFALVAFQYRYRWVTPLILVHAAADFTAILSLRPLADLAIAATAVGFVALGLVILGRQLGRPQNELSSPPSSPVP